MSLVFRAFLLLVFAFAFSPSAEAAEGSYSPHILGKTSAPIRVDEYSSMTCSHCADFVLTILPEIEKRYINTGKVYFVLHDFPLDAVSLKAAAVAQCMPEDVYIPFSKTLFSALKDETFGGYDSEAVLFQYAALGGLPAEKAKACAENTKLQDAIISDRTKAAAKYKIEATPTFVINNGAEVINGAVSVEAFATTFDRLLAPKKKKK
ncbi:MAG: thioredoxin domain-containing protein [Bdellovibrionales bacterium]